MARDISPHSLRHAVIANALDAGVPLRDAQILARHLRRGIYQPADAFLEVHDARKSFAR